MILFIAIAAYFALSAVFVLSICVLSARLRANESWEESPLTEGYQDLNVSPEYQADVA